MTSNAGKVDVAADLEQLDGGSEGDSKDDQDDQRSDSIFGET